MKGRLKNLVEPYRSFKPSEVENIFQDLNIRIRAWIEKEGFNLIDKERSVDEKTVDTIVMEEKFKLEHLIVEMNIMDQYIIDLNLKFDEDAISRDELEGFEHYLDGFREEFPLIEVEKNQ